jgi:hypothetical protein
LHYPTPEEKDIQSEFDEMIGNLTILNASCCQVYAQWFASHFAHKSNKEPDKVESIFIIDMMFTAMPSHCKLSGKARKEKYNEHHKEVKAKLDILSDAAYFLPFIANLAIALQLHKNKHDELMLIFGATSEMCRVFQCKRDAVKIDLKTKLVHLLCRLPHPEVLLLERLGNHINLIPLYDELITFIFRQVPEVDVPDGVTSTLFWKIAYGDKTGEEIAEMNELRSHIMLCGILSYYMPKVFPDMEDEEIVAFKMRVLNGNLQSGDDDMIRKCRCAMGREGAAQQAWLPHYLKKLFPYMSDDDREDLRSRLSSGDTLSSQENDMISQCRSAMASEGGDKGGKIRELRKRQPGITDEEIDHILKNNLYDSVSSWTVFFLSSIQAKNKPC